MGGESVGFKVIAAMDLANVNEVLRHSFPSAPTEVDYRALRTWIKNDAAVQAGVSPSEIDLKAHAFKVKHVNEVEDLITAHLEAEGWIVHADPSDELPNQLGVVRQFGNKKPLSDFIGDRLTHQKQRAFYLIGNDFRHLPAQAERILVSHQLPVTLVVIRSHYSYSPSNALRLAGSPIRVVFAEDITGWLPEGGESPAREYNCLTA